MGTKKHYSRKPKYYLVSENVGEYYSNLHQLLKSLNNFTDDFANVFSLENTQDVQELTSDDILFYYQNGVIIKRYYSKRALYNFLKTHGYKIPPIKEMIYNIHQGCEYLQPKFNSVYDDGFPDIRISTLGCFNAKIRVSTYKYSYFYNEAVEVSRSIFDNNKLIKHNEFTPRLGE